MLLGSLSSAATGRAAQLSSGHHREGICSSLRARGSCRPCSARTRAPGGVVVAAAKAADDTLAKVKARRRGKCYGCGTALQTDAPGELGYVERVQFDMKKQVKQMDQMLCARCKELCHGRFVPAVEDFSQRRNRKKADAPPEAEPRVLISPEDLREQLKEVRDRKALVVMLVDMMDASGSMLSRVRDLVGGNPVVIIGTKADLLPKGTDLALVEDWLNDTVAYKRINAIATHLVSSHTKQGLQEAAHSVLVNRQGRDVYVLGAANVGKSAFVRALLKEMGDFSSRHFDPAASAHGKFLPVESGMPGTTLGIVALRAFASGGALHDTPGVHLDHRLPHLLTPDEIRTLHPRRKLRAFIPKGPAEVADEEGADRPSATYHWGGVARFDIEACPASTGLMFYGPKALQVLDLPCLSEEEELEAVCAENDELAEDELEEEEDWMFGAESVASRGGLRVARTVRVEANGSADALLDISISGVPGWVTVLAPGATGAFDVRVWAPRGVEVFARPALPVARPKLLPYVRKDIITLDRELAGDDDIIALEREAVTGDELHA